MMQIQLIYILAGNYIDLLIPKSIKFVQLKELFQLFIT